MVLKGAGQRQRFKLNSACGDLWSIRGKRRERECETNKKCRERFPWITTPASSNHAPMIAFFGKCGKVICRDPFVGITQRHLNRNHIVFDVAAMAGGVVNFADSKQPELSSS